MSAMIWGEYPKALSSYNEALKIQKQSLSPDDPNLAITLNNIGNVYKKIE